MVHPVSFLLGLGAAVALPAIAKVFRPIAVELAAAGMALYEEALRAAAEKVETIEDIVAEARARRAAAVASVAQEAAATTAPD